MNKQPMFDIRLLLAIGVVSTAAAVGLPNISDQAFGLLSTTSATTFGAAIGVLRGDKGNDVY